MKATSQEIKDFFFKEEKRLKEKIENTLSTDSLQEWIDTENIISQIKSSFLEYFFKRKV